MGKTAVAAADREVAGTDRNIVRTGEMAVAARGILDKFPDRIFTNPGKGSGFCHVFDSRDKNPGCPAVVTRDLRLVGHGLDDLIGYLFAVIAVGSVFREDETVRHERIVNASGFINLLLGTIRQVFHFPDYRRLDAEKHQNGPNTVTR